jgi:hypothetical protein
MKFLTEITQAQLLAAIIFCMFSIIFLNPYGDAIRDNGKKEKQKRIEGITYLAFALSMFFFMCYGTLYSSDMRGNFNMILLLMISYTLLRLSIHSIIYNLTLSPKMPWYHLGKTSSVDRMLSEFDKKSLAITYIGAGILGLIVLFFATFYNILSIYM